MCLGSRTTQSPAASNTNYFGTNPWGDPAARPAVPDLPTPNVTTTAQGGSTGTGNLKIGGSKKSIQRTFDGPGSKKRSGSGSVTTGGVNY